MPTLPPAMLQLLAPFAPLFARRVWRRALVLVAGTLLVPGKRTVCDAATREEQCLPRLTAQTPQKKPKGAELTDEQRAFNRRLGAVRIRVEHGLGWRKHWAILATRFRCAHDRYTPILCVLCGLVNAQTARWQATQRAYSA